MERQKYIHPKLPKRRLKLAAQYLQEMCETLRNKGVTCAYVNNFNKRGAYERR